MLNYSEFILESKKLDYGKVNPFKQSICVLGKPGIGKTVTIENILKSIPNMEYEFITPPRTNNLPSDKPSRMSKIIRTASKSGLLYHYSSSGKCQLSKLGKLIMVAQKNPDKLYTAVIDDCHNPNVMDMINDELIQCISTYRNNGKRFISLDDEASELYSGLEKHAGNILLPDNFGFVFISSNPDVIVSNTNFFNRVDVYVMVKKPKVGVSIKDTKYFKPIGNKENGVKTDKDIKKIFEVS